MIPLNLTIIHNLAKHFGNTLSLTTKPQMHFKKNQWDNHYKRLYWDDNYVQLFEREKYDLKWMFKFLETRKNWVLKKVTHLTKIMPLLGTAPSSAISDSIHFRIHCFASIHLFIMKGIFGTFMGLYNKNEATSLFERGDEEHTGQAEATDSHVVSSTRSKHGSTWEKGKTSLYFCTFLLCGKRLTFTWWKTRSTM